jgi:hypothetical protein
MGRSTVERGSLRRCWGLRCYVLIEVGGKGSIRREEPWMEDLMRQKQWKRSWQEFWNTRSLMERRYSEERSDPAVKRAVCISSVI